MGTRLRAVKVRAEVIAVGIKSHDLRYASHQMTLQNATNITIEIHRCACQLFDQLWDGTAIRHLGIHTEVRLTICPVESQEKKGLLIIRKSG